MKKSILMKLLVLAVCAAMLLSLFACGPEVEDPTEEPTQQETEGTPEEKPTDKTTEAPTQNGGDETDPAETDPAETDPVETDPVETDPVETDPVETDPAETDPVETDPVETDPVETDPVETDPVETDPACDGNHSYVAKGRQGHYCEKCGNPGKNNPIIAHTYEDKNGIPTCSVCGYEAACKGEHTAYIGDEVGHKIAGCEECGMAEGTEVEAHTYKYENDKYACTVCGWTLTCPTDGVHGLVNDGEKGHHAAACAICNVAAGETVPHEFANSVCKCGFEAACKGQHKIEADENGHSIGACDTCGAAEQVKQPHVWGSEYFTDGVSYAYGCSDCGYAKYTKVLTDKVAAFMTPGNIQWNKADAAKTDLSSSTKYQIATSFEVDENGMPYVTMSGTGVVTEEGDRRVSQFLWNRALVDNSNGRSEHEEYSFDIGNAKYLIIKARVAFTSKAKISINYSTVGADGKVDVAIPFAKSETPEWVTYVIDLEKACGDKHAKAEGAETYAVDTFYFHMQPFAAEDTFEVAYIAFVEGGWAEVGAFVEEETVVSVSKSNVGSVVDPTTGGCVGEHALEVAVVDGEYKSVCACGYVKSSYGVKEDGPNRFVAAEILATSGNVTGYLDKELCYDEDGTAYVRYDNYWANRDNWGDFSIHLDKALGKGGATGQYLVIKFRVGNAGNGVKYIQAFANTNQSDKKNLVGEGEVGFAKVNDDKWHTVVIDLAERVSKPGVAFLPDADGSYNVRYLSIRAFASTSVVSSDDAEGRYFYTYYTADGQCKQVLGKENRLTAEQMAEGGYTTEKIHKCGMPADAYVDFSFVALCDSIDDIKNIVSAETYEWSADSTTSALKNTADNSCAAHMYQDVLDADGVTHKIQCATCENVLRTYSISADINYYANLGSMSYFTNAGTGVDKLLIDPVAGVLYNSFYATGSTHWNLTGGSGAGAPTSATHNSGEYVVMKVRAAGEDKTSMSLYLSSNGATNVVSFGTSTLGTFTVNAKDGWVVVVAKFGSLSAYATNTDAKLYFMGMPGKDCKLDIAYLAVVDSIDEMKTLLGEGETYVYYGESFSNIGVEYDQDGNKVPCKEGECVVEAPVITDGLNGETIYTYTCPKCEAEYVKTIDASVVKYYAPHNLLNDAKMYFSLTNNGVKTFGLVGNVPATSFNNYRQLIYMRGNADLGSGQNASDDQAGTFNIGNAQYAVIKFRSDDAAAWLQLSLSFEGLNGTTAVAEEDLIGSGYHKPDGTQDTWKDAEGKDVSGVRAGNEYVTGNGYYSLPLLKTGDADGEWVTAIIDLAKAYGHHYAKAEGAEDYVVDYLVIDLAGAVDIAYLGFVDGDMSKAYSLAENGKVRIVNDTEGGYDTVDLDAAMGTESFPEKLEELDYTTNEVAVEEGNKDGYFYTYTAIHDGTVTLYFNSWAMEEGVEGEIIVTNTTTGEVKKLSVDGVDNYGMELTVAVNEGDILLIQVISVDSEDAEANPAATLNWTGNFKYPVGHEKNPVSMDYDSIEYNENESVATITITAPVGTTYYSGFGGKILSINGEDKGLLDDTGVFSITNEGEAEAEYVVVFSTPIGESNNPDTLVLGDQSVEIPEGSNMGYYYSWTATEAGKLTIVVNSTTGWFYNISRTYWGEVEDWTFDEATNDWVVEYVPGYVTESGDWVFSNVEGAVNTVVIEVNEGDVVTVNVNTCDPNPEIWETPAGTITVTASFIAAHVCAENSDAEFVCVAGNCTICGELVPAAESHTDPDAATGKCTVCGEKLILVAVTKEIAIKSGTATDKPEDKLSATWAGEGFAVVAAGDTAYGNSNMMPAYFKAPVGYTITVNANQISKVVFTASSAANAESLAKATFAEGVTVTVDGSTVVVTVNEGTLDAISLTITEVATIKNVAVSFME